MLYLPLRILFRLVPEPAARDNEQQQRRTPNDNKQIAIPTAVD